MAKIKTHAIAKEDREAAMSDFLALVLRLGKKQEVVEFLLGLMTPSEALMFARRIQIARELLGKKNTYEEIRAKLNVGYETITKMDRWLHSGDEKRDRWLAEEISRLESVSTSKKGRKYSISPSPLNRYPEHRMMKELLARLLG